MKVHGSKTNRRRVMVGILEVHVREEREREREIKSQPCHGRINRGVEPSTVPGAKPKLGTISLS